MFQKNFLATPAQEAANKLFLERGLDLPFDEARQVLSSLGFSPTDDEIEMGWEDASFDVEYFTELQAIEELEKKQQIRLDDMRAEFDYRFQHYLY
jgi:hypothetical protein